MSATIYGGASQMVGIELFGQRVAALADRGCRFSPSTFATFSTRPSIGRRIAPLAGLQRFLAFFLLVDPQYAETETRAERGEPVTFAWYLGLASPIYVPWVLCTWLGAIFGGLGRSACARPRLAPADLFPRPGYGLSQAPTLAPGVSVSAVASIAAAIFIGSPWHVSVGALAGIVLAAAMPHPHMDGGDVP